MPMGGVSMTRLPWVLMVLLGLMTAWLVVRLLWLLITGPGSITAEQTSLLSPSLGGARQIDPSHRVAFWSGIFGDSKAPVSESNERLPLDQSAFVLVGVLARSSGSEAGTGYAIIRSNGSNDQIYRVDDELPDGRRVVRIEKDSVIVNSGIIREVLMLKDRRRDNLGQSPMQSSQTQQEPLPMGIGIASVGGLGQQLALGARGSQNGATSFAEVPTGGYRLRPGPDTQAFIAAGLQVGDILLSVNGQPIDAFLSNPEDAMAWLAELGSGQSVALTIDRQGRQMTVQPTMNEIRDALNKRMRSP